MRRNPLFIALVFVIVGGVFLSACSERRKGDEPAQPSADEHGMKSDWKFTLPRGDPSEGRRLFIEAECYKCHDVTGETFSEVAASEERVGPELSQMAGMHPAEFFAESIINPNAAMDPRGKDLGYIGDDGTSKMPDYSDLLTTKQVADLAAYIDSLKVSQSPKHEGH